MVLKASSLSTHIFATRKLRNSGTPLSDAELDKLRGLISARWKDIWDEVKDRTQEEDVRLTGNGSNSVNGLIRRKHRLKFSSHPKEGNL